ncbi:S1C family serine protease [Cellulomonas triticagri]|uniref:S1C family serine protease n=1 Tax=Cellulomonas triticagri TaxID=2483352 RepID=UPI0018F2DD01|nr:trypsin-like peptidase domain-containing protein [Cellulomonas triticagri]
MSSTPEGPQDATGAPQPERADATEQAADRAASAAGQQDAAQAGTAATQAVPAPPQDAPTQRIAPTPTQQLPSAPSGPQGGPTYPAVPQEAQEPQGQHHDPRPQPRYGQYAAPQHPGYPQPGQQQGAPGAYPQPQAQQQHAGDPLAAFGRPEPQDPHQSQQGQHQPTGDPGYPQAFGAEGGPQGPGGPGGTRTRTDRNRLWLPVVGVGVGAALLASLGTAALVGAFDQGSSGTRAADISSIGQSSTDTVPVSGSSAENPDWQKVAAAVQDSVVAIQVTTSSGEAQGSGVIVDDEGHIVTNNHVVAGAQDGQVQVTLTDGRIFTADVVGTDPTTDLAVIKLQDAPDDLSPAALGDSSEVTVGDPVMAVGNPLGLANTVTTGIVSALDRPVSTTEDGSNESVVTNAIQIDAAVNPGNSGGPLFDAQGRVIGITSSIATTSSESGSIGLGFAIPVNLADMIASQLIADGTAEHAFLGVGLVDGTATADGVTRSGAQVQQVTEGSPAAQAGVQTGDVIVGIDGKAVGGAQQLTGYVRTHASGDETTLTLVRDGKSMEVDVTLAVREETASSGSGSDQGSGQNPEDMTPEQLWEWFQQQQGQQQGGGRG